MMGEPARNM